MANMILCPHCMSINPADSLFCRSCGQSTNANNRPHQLSVGTALNRRYLVGCAIGGGGFGITYIGYDTVLNIKVAIKEYYPSGAANRSGTPIVYPVNGAGGSSFEIGKKHFLSEAQILANFIDDANIVTLRDYFEENGTAYIIMEFLEGQDLREYLNNHGAFTFDEALALVEPAIKALGRIHASGIIHGDISPSNIMRLNNGEIKILDFGTARNQESSDGYDSSIMLKPGYAPEEQFRQQGEHGTWTDVYAISATIYTLITGTIPENSTDRVYKDTLQSPVKLGAKITRAQEAALLKGMAVNAKNRTQTMGELLDNLKSGISPAKPAIKIAAAAVALLIAAACFILPNVLPNRQVAETVQVSAPPQASETPASQTASSAAPPERVKPVTLSDDAYPSPIYSEMEPIEGFSSRVLENDENKKITLTDCLIGNGMMAFVVDIDNKCADQFRVYSWRLKYGEDYSDYIDEIYGPEGYADFSVAAGESKSDIIWFSTDLMYLRGVNDFTTLVLSGSGSFADSSDTDDKYFNFEKTIYFPETVHISSKIAANPVKIYANAKFEIIVYGVSLRRDGANAAMIVAMNRLKSNDDYESDSVYVTFDNDIYLNGEKFFGNSSYISEYMYTKYGEMRTFELIEFKYAYSSPTDEMNVVHTGGDLPETLTLTLNIGTAYNSKDDLLKGKELTFSIDENGLGFIK